MKTRFFKLQGTEKEMTRFLFEVDKWAKNLMPQELETRVYVVDGVEHNTKHLTDDMFMTLAEAQGTVYTLQGFQDDFNIGKYEIHYVIRFINVPLNN